MNSKRKSYANKKKNTLYNSYIAFLAMHCITQYYDNYVLRLEGIAQFRANNLMKEKKKTEVNWLDIYFFTA